MGRVVGVVAIARDLGRVLVTQVSSSTSSDSLGSSLSGVTVLGHVLLCQDAPSLDYSTSLAHPSPRYIPPQHRSRKSTIWDAWR
jgi:hypothetical protein